MSVMTFTQSEEITATQSPPWITVVAAGRIIRARSVYVYSAPSEVYWSRGSRDPILGEAVLYCRGVRIDGAPFAYWSDEAGTLTLRQPGSIRMVYLREAYPTTPFADVDHRRHIEYALANPPADAGEWAH